MRVDSIERTDVLSSRVLYSRTTCACTGRVHARLFARVVGALSIAISVTTEQSRRDHRLMRARQ